VSGGTLNHLWSGLKYTPAQVDSKAVFGVVQQREREKAVAGDLALEHFLIERVE
jgi:hypothetical protein